MKLYISVGEKLTADPAVHSEEWKLDRKISAEKSTTHLSDKIVQIQQKSTVTDASETPAKAIIQQEPSVPTTNIPPMTVPTMTVPPPTIPTPTIPPMSVLPLKRHHVDIQPSPNPHDNGSSSEKREPRKNVGRPKKPKLSNLDCLGLPIAKFFEIENAAGQMEFILFTGRIVSFDKKSVFWKVRYEDDDEEEFDEADLRNGALLYLEQRGHQLAPEELQKMVDTFVDKPARAQTASG
jgi:hypothetical protein